MTTSNTFAALAAAGIVPGARVRFALTYGDYPMTPIQPGATGKVTSIQEDHIAVLMDEPMDELKSWGNVRQVCVIEESGQRLPDYANPAERYLEAINAQPENYEPRVDQIMAENFYLKEHTGGGCMAWLRQMGEHHILITDDGGTGLYADPDAPDWLVGSYDAQGGFVCNRERHTLARALEVAQIMPAPFPQGNQYYIEDFTAEQRLAIAFSILMQDELERDKLHEAIYLNRSERGSSCHTQDFCDANMTMDAAFKFTFGRSIDLSKDPDPENNLLWNEAWDIAKRAEFDASRISPQSVGAETMRDIITRSNWIAVERWTEADGDHLGFLEMRENTGCGRDCAAVLRAAETLCNAIERAWGKDEDSAIAARDAIVDTAERVVCTFFYG